jgi:hypothetical protein
MASSATKLRATLTHLLQSHTGSNAALNDMLHDYQRFHLALAVGGGLSVVLLLAVSVMSWRSFRRAAVASPRPASVRSERRIWLALCGGSAAVAFLMLVIVAANASAAVHPRSGFSLLVTSLPQVPNSHFAPIYASADRWLHSPRTTVPPLIQHQVNARLGWQRPKAIFCGIGMVAAAILTAVVWRRRITRLRTAGKPSRLIATTHSSLGVVTAAATVLLVMAVANAQASIAPLTISTFGVWTPWPSHLHLGWLIYRCPLPSGHQRCAFLLFGAVVVSRGWAAAHLGKRGRCRRVQQLAQPPVLRASERQVQRICSECV